MAARRKKFVQRPVVLEDAKSIKALAHPARLAIIDELFAGRELTATECAEIVGMSPSAMSYHLRALERAGMIERAPSSDDGRERPWRAKGTSITVNSTSSKLALAATTALATTVVERLGAGLRDWLARGEQEDPAWREVAGVSDARLWLTHQEAEQVERSSREFVEQFRGRTADNHPEGARRVRVTVLMYPTDDGSS